jgi:hypothetical protein
MSYLFYLTTNEKDSRLGLLIKLHDKDYVDITLMTPEQVGVGGLSICSTVTAQMTREAAQGRMVDRLDCPILHKSRTTH